MRGSHSEMLLKMGPKLVGSRLTYNKETGERSIQSGIWANKYKSLMNIPDIPIDDSMTPQEKTRVTIANELNRQVDRIVANVSGGKTTEIALRATQLAWKRKQRGCGEETRPLATILRIPHLPRV